ncbi:3-deoxy-D-manno-octulosonic acid transferase [Oryzibacter oryziterrae]|uniref:3-deoxy-D-manno-octulosonic acid transferase n=1 Tax=Oryzibacter oryziterrae TaxID=2766474 RepID=UPI001F3C17A1|nr:3-deoxy-D-manno-octulosonic acid transferase [Oryzibacter oryziterrae]
MADFSDALLGAYVALTRVGGPIGRAVVGWRLKQGKEDALRWRERLGEASVARPAGRVVWVHAVSVGESVSAVPLIEQLAAEGFTVLVTTVTTTSAAVLAARTGAAVIHQFAPLDLAGFVDRFLDHWRPELAILVESEIWPVTIARLKARRVPLVISNARMSPRSLDGWGRFAFATRAIFRSIGLVLAQTPGDAERYEQLGCGETRAVGNMKFEAGVPDGSAEAEAQLRGAFGSRPVLLAASTHPGEEEIALAAFARVRAERPDCLLVLAPRHPHRGEAVADLAGGDFTVKRRAVGELPDEQTAVYVADTMGELGTLYRLASVAVIGGTLVPDIGGHNPIEPARLKTAMLAGPHYANWPDVYRSFIECGGLTIAENAETIAEAALVLLKDSSQRKTQISAALSVVESYAGALGRTMAALTPLLARREA